MTINHAKLVRLSGDLDQFRVTQSGMAAEHRYFADSHRAHLESLRSGMARRKGPNHEVLDADLDDLAKLSTEQAFDAHISLQTVRAALADRERMHDLKRRLDALELHVAPLATLVARLTKYAEAH